MRSEQSRSIISRPLATTLILLASGLACSAALAGPKAKAGSLQGVQIQGRTVESVKIDDMRGASSYGTVTDSRGIESKYLFRNKVIVQSNDWEKVEIFISSIPGVQLGRELGTQGHFRVIETSSVGAAFRIQRALHGAEGVLSVEIDSGLMPQNDRFDSYLRATQPLRAAGLSPAVYSNAQAAKGVIALDGESEPASFTVAQWNFVNTGAGGPPGGAGNDNNILESIYSVDMLSGAGVNVGLLSIVNNMHLDIDHSELFNPGVRTGGYMHSLSMTADQDFTPDEPYFTGYAGLIAAERTLPGPDIQGIAPSAGVATLYRGPTPLFESDGFSWKPKDVQIKVHQLTLEYDVPGAAYNTSRINSYVTDSFKNSYKFGRKGRGTINIFGTGVGFNLLPNPYTAPFGGNPEPWDGVANNPNQLAVSVSNGFVTPGALYVGGQTHQYPPANDRNAFVINSVSEDGNVDSLAAVGPAIFASVYAGSSNEFWSGNQNISGRGIRTIGANNAPVADLPAAGVQADLLNANMTGSSTAAGIMALMLEANPKLLVRDIQHIFFQSIQESTKAGSIKWPNYSASRVYYFPDAAPTDPAFLRRSFWQTNNGFYNNAAATPAVVNQSVRHSDQYGFGIVDAELAIQKAKTWPGVPQLVLLDTGIVGDVNQGDDTGDQEDPRVPVPIIDALFDTPTVEADVLGIDGAVGMVISTGLQQIRFCVRDNIRIESIIVELTIEGTGSNDLYMTLTSPTGSRTILSLPTTLNTLPGVPVATPPAATVPLQTVEDLNENLADTAFASGEVNGNVYAYYQHPFLTYKHWGEFSGGSWSIDFLDYGPDEANPEGIEPGDLVAVPPEPGGNMIVNLGEIGVPGSENRDSKTVTAFRVKIFGTETGADVFLGCAPGTTTCPGDLNGDGMVDTADLILFLDWFQTGNALADISQDGTVDFADIIAFRGLFVPGPCTTTNTNFVGGRPRPGTTNPSDTNPTTRPI